MGLKEIVNNVIDAKRRFDRFIGRKCYRICFPEEFKENIKSIKIFLKAQIKILERDIDNIKFMERDNEYNLEALDFNRDNSDANYFFNVHCDVIRHVLRYSDVYSEASPDLLKRYLSLSEKFQEELNKFEPNYLL